GIGGAALRCILEPWPHVIQLVDSRRLGRAGQRANAAKGYSVAMFLGRFAGLLLLAALCSPYASPARASFVLATEDTLALAPVTELDPIEVHTTRLEIGEIVERCIRHEKEVRERIAAHDFTELLKTVLTIEGKKEKQDRQIVIEEVRRMKTRRPAYSEETTLARSEYELVGGERKDRDAKTVDKNGAKVEVRYEDFDDLPFYLEDPRGYEFQIKNRQIVGDSVIYAVGLAPKSQFEIAPRGTIWIDTSDFQILREEFNFGDRVPMPMFVKSIGPVVREREKIGNLWVIQRVLVRADLRTGWLKFLDGDIPDRVEFVATSRDHHLEESR
ncbi:MAG TPA: hypothetical protein VFR10_09195, partial [bacterium]|nr:hypothetical protein [bacterium]